MRTTRDASRTGAAFATRSTPRCAPRPTTKSVRRSSRRTARANLDAALLMMPLVGFLPATDERMQGTVDAIRRELTTDGFVMRYTTDSAVDGLPPGEGVVPAVHVLAGRTTSR